MQIPTCTREAKLCSHNRYVVSCVNLVMIGDRGYLTTALMIDLITVFVMDLTTASKIDLITALTMDVTTASMIDLIIAALIVGK